MKRVGVREFRDHATKYLAGGETLQIERHGKTLGYFIPADRATVEDRRQALDRLEATVGRILARTGMSEEELVELLTPNGRG